MKYFLLFFMISPAISAVARNNYSNSRFSDKNRWAGLPGFFPGKDRNPGASASPVTDIPLKRHLPHYESVVPFGKELTREEMEANASYYFQNVFGSRAYRLETEKHIYSGYCSYMFSVDRKLGVPGLYKVYFQVSIVVKNNRYYIDLYDFTIENQQLEVNLEQLMHKARNNDATANSVLALFHEKNEDQLRKIYNTMASKENVNGPFGC